MKPLVIALLGRAGSGKTSAAKFLKEHYDCSRLSFAWPIKKLLKRIFFFTDSQLYGKDKEEVDPRYGISSREAMQRLGEGAKEVMGSTIWIDRLFKRIKENKVHPNFYIIDDARHIEEVNLLLSSKDFNCFVIKLVANETVKNIDKFHNSEAEVDLIPQKLIDYEIFNNKDKKFFDNLNDTIKDIFSKRT